MGKVFEQGIVVSIGNQKGGVGKSVITSLVANYIHQEWGEKLKIIVVDCDDLQGSLIKLRERDLLAQNGEDDKNYRLLQISSMDLPSNIEFLTEEYDIIFLDLPGNLKQPGVLKCYTWVDVLIVPTQTSSLDLQSTIDFANMYKNEIISEREKLNIKTAIYGLFSRVDVQNIDYKEFGQLETFNYIPIIIDYDRSIIKKTDDIIVSTKMKKKEQEERDKKIEKFDGELRAFQKKLKKE